MTLRMMEVVCQSLEPFSILLHWGSLGFSKLSTNWSHLLIPSLLMEFPCFRGNLLLITRLVRRLAPAPCHTQVSPVSVLQMLPLVFSLQVKLTQQKTKDIVSIQYQMNIFTKKKLQILYTSTSIKVDFKLCILNHQNVSFAWQVYTEYLNCLVPNINIHFSVKSTLIPQIRRIHFGAVFPLFEAWFSL